MTDSNNEELVGCLWLIAALIAWNGGHDTIACWLLVKAVLDYGLSIYCAIRDRRTK